MWLTSDHFTAAFWVAVIPAFLSFGLILVAVLEPQRSEHFSRAGLLFDRQSL